MAIQIDPEVLINLRVVQSNLNLYSQQMSQQRADIPMPIANQLYNCQTVILQLSRSLDALVRSLQRVP